MRLIIAAVLCFAFTFVSASASATNEAWTAAKATDQVRYTLDKETWLPLRKGMAVLNKAWISTGPRGRLQLLRGAESIVFQPNICQTSFPSKPTIERSAARAIWRARWRLSLPPT